MPPFVSQPGSFPAGLFCEVWGNRFMSRLFVWLLLLVCSGSAVLAAPSPTPPLAWVFDIHPDKQLTPQGKVFLKVGARRVLIEPKSQFEFSTLGRAEYKDYKVPAASLTACAGWFAGAGEYLYVVRRQNSLRVYRRWADEQAPEMPWKPIRTIALK